MFLGLLILRLKNPIKSIILKIKLKEADIEINSIVKFFVIGTLIFRGLFFVVYYQTNQKSYLFFNY